MNEDELAQSHQSAAYVAGTGLALPSQRVSQTDAIDVLQRMFPREDPALIRSMVRRSGIEQRFIVPTLDAMLDETTFTERNRQYCEAASELAARAASDALSDAGIAPSEIDVIIDVSCTGLAIPALDVELVSMLGLSRNVTRVPVAESGCAAGALAFNVASSLARAGQTVLVVAVELCTLSFCSEDRTRTNLVASVIFGDGAAAAVISPDRSERARARIEATRSHLIANTHELMGFEFGTHGMRLILDRELPAVVAANLESVIAQFVTEHGWDASSLDYHLVHPGGRGILDSYAAKLGLAADGLRFSRDVLANCGNLSSASILAVLRSALSEIDTSGRGGRAVMLAIGPGISLELALLTFTGAS